MKHALRRRGAIAIAAAAALTFGAVTAATGAQAGRADAPPAHAGQAKHVYIVQMLDAPVVAYDGSIAGLAATKPKAGEKINPFSAKVEKYAAYLDATHASTLAKVGGRKIYDYRYTFNGFAAEMTELAAVKLAGLPGVVAVTADEKRQLLTADTPDFLGLDDPGGIWEQLGGPVGGKKQAGAGEGVIVGIIDSGINPESPSFTDRDNRGKLVFQQIPGWHGKCTPGEAFNASHCNQKLIGAQWYNSGFGGNAGTKAEFPYEFISPRDFDGHGTHTASTAAGNYGVPVSVGGVDFGEVSGIAPRARVAAYKVCWGTGDEGGCFGADSVAAIDQAVADGVDVLNYSISGSTTSTLDPVSVAFLFAADAGVFVAASAGNAGATSTVNHNVPWLTTVAASTHNRTGEGAVTLGDGTTIEGGSLATAVGPAPFVDSFTIPAAGATAGDAALCRPGSLDPAAAAGTIVLCDRGAIARTDKSLAVQMAGGVGMIMVNPTPNSVNADAHWVPSVHVGDEHYDTLHDYAATSGATASIAQSTLIYDAPAPLMATFSSRGPALAVDGDILKPDVTAPGVDVLAAVAPPGNNGRSYDFYSGTSMSSPHVAGLAALMKDRHPTWSPMMIKSAFMTTAYPTLDGGVFDHGAGHVDPNPATDPGLVYDSNFVDWIQWLCGAGELGGPLCDPVVGFGSDDPSNLNLASIAIGSLAGTQTVSRTVTNVGPGATYHVAVDAPPGVDVAVTPSSITLATGQSATYEVTFTTNASATLNEHTSGSLTWSHGPHHVRSPIAVRPVAVAAPAEILTSGDTSFEIGFGFSGDFSTAVRGLVPALAEPGSVVDDPANDINTALGTGVGVTFHVVPVTPGTTLARISLFDDFTSGDDDLDLYVFDADTFDFLGGSGSGTSAEEVNIVDPTAAALFIVVHGWQTDGGGTADYTLFSWMLGATDEGNMTVTAPAVGVQGGTGTIDLAFTGLTAGTKYLGAIDYTLAGSDGGSTIVRVDP